VRDGLGSLGPVRAVYLLLASYAALWLLVPFGVRAFPPHLQRAAAIYLLAAVVLPFVGSPERMEEAIFPVVVSAAVLATRAWPVALVLVLALGNALFIARVGGDARIPTVVAWSGLAVAIGTVVWSFRPGRAASAPPALATPPSGPRGTTAPST